jgi:hypothetical protein
MCDSSTAKVLNSPIGNFHAGTATIKIMKENRPFFSWRLTLILLLGCIGGLAVALFGRHVASMSDLPQGPTPLSWTFKASRASVAATFPETNAAMEMNLRDGPVFPELDSVIPAETEYALFALG